MVSVLSLQFQGQGIFSSGWQDEKQTVMRIASDPNVLSMFFMVIDTALAVLVYRRTFHLLLAL